MKKVLVFGTFDGLHPGHVSFFQQARKLGEKLVVVVGRDATVKKVKGRLPVMKEGERLAEVKKSELVDEARLGNLGDPYEVIKQIQPDIIALGYDQNSFTANLVVKLREMGIVVEIVRLKPFEPEKYHSSKIKGL